MRHQKKRHRLGRDHAHRKATLVALSNSLIEHKRITTTVSKAKALRGFIEPLITRSKEDTTHNRRQVFRYLQSNQAVSTLFGEISAQIGDRPGGYTRVVKLGRRSGDGAPLAMIELVDYNDVQPETTKSGRSRTRRSGGKSRRRRSKAGAAAVPEAAETKTQAPAETKPEAATKPESEEAVAAPEAAAAPEAEAPEAAAPEAAAPEAAADTATEPEAATEAEAEAPEAAAETDAAAEAPAKEEAATEADASADQEPASSSADASSEEKAREDGEEAADKDEEKKS